MKTIARILLITALPALYFFSLAEVMGFLSRIEFPWQPFSGKSGLEIRLLLVEDILIVVIASIPIAIAVALVYAGRAFQIGLLIALPSVLYLAWAISRTFGLVSTRHAAIVMPALKILYLPLIPALLSQFLSRIFHYLRSQRLGKLCV